MTSNKIEIIIKYLKLIIKTNRMAKKENTFLLLSLEEEKAKKVANVINSEVSRKLLDSLANKDSTESELSRDLGIPISTVHYNLRQLVEAGLVKADEFHYSEKGKEVNHYSIANKYIIIAPKSIESIASKLKRIFPVFLVAILTGFLLQALNIAQTTRVTETSTMNMVMKQAPQSIIDTLKQTQSIGSGAMANQAAKANIPATMYSETANETMRSAVQPMQDTINQTYNYTQQVTNYIISDANAALWFIAGALFTLAIYLLYDIAKERFK